MYVVYDLTRSWRDRILLRFSTRDMGARGFLREERRSAISEVRSGEERENREEVRKPLVPTTVD